MVRQRKDKRSPTALRSKYQLRLRDDERAAWEVAAALENLSLPSWVRYHLGIAAREILSRDPSLTTDRND